jgi:hypothetical protein
MATTPKSEIVGGIGDGDSGHMTVALATWKANDRWERVGNQIFVTIHYLESPHILCFIDTSFSRKDKTREPQACLSGVYYSQGNGLI